MHAVEHNTHTLPGSDEGRNADDKTNQRKDPPGATSTAQSKDDGDEEASNNATDTQSACKDDTRAIAVADSPANEVRMGLATQ